MKKVAVTGGVASGKTTVCDYLKMYGAYVISTDEIVHQLLTPDTTTGKKIITDLVPNCVKEREIDRKTLAKLVFSDPEKLKTLENILHPAVLKEIEREYKRVKNQKIFSFFVAEIPLLYECEWESHFDLTIAVSSEEDLCKKRYKKPDYSKRMARQLPMKEKQSRAELKITNNGSFDDLKKQVQNIIPQLKY